jgi:signal transduction histidine kinase
MAPSYRTREDERAWLDTHRPEFLNQWVALNRGELVASGSNPSTVYEEARAKGVVSPHLLFVEDEPKFSVDTHLFRELGELLVGRDSTALVELIKNAYDADARTVTVDGERLGHPQNARITITDDGIGMTEDQFKKGFLRVASRLKEQGSRQSLLYHRRFTGAKGIGRLAAHKLARVIHIYSVPIPEASSNGREAVDATIDWDIVETAETLESVDPSAVLLETEKVGARGKPGTIIELSRLRRKWTPSERTNFFSEVQTFSPPKILTEPPTAVVDEPLLFERPKVYDTTKNDPGFKVKLTGDLDAGEDYWGTALRAAQWLIEIDASGTRGKVRFSVTPTKRGKAEFPDASGQRFTMDHPDLKSGPFFQARILIREGRSDKNERAWLGRSAGIRVYMEGFRVLPYGETKDDWLSINADYGRRDKRLSFLSNLSFAGKPGDEDEGLLVLKNNSYFGAVFLTQDDAPSLRMLVNREGFIPEAGYEHLVDIVRTGIYLSVRVRASSKITSRQERSQKRRLQAADSLDDSRKDLRELVAQSVAKANTLASEAKRLALSGDFKGAQYKIAQAAMEFSQGSITSERLITEGSVLRVLASVGTQMASFVHEINSLLGSAIALEGAISNLRNDASTPPPVRKKLAQLHRALGDLRRSIERQASYLTDIVTPDSRRRRSRQPLDERFNAAARLIETAAQRRDIQIDNKIPTDLRSPAMFPAEVLVVFSNLLSNAVKAAGEGGKILATGSGDQTGTTLRIENTGVSVNPSNGEKWFRPFESTTIRTDPVLGQGMGMGLPITRNLLEEYGASIKFTQPTRGYSTAVEITFPR